MGRLSAPTGARIQLPLCLRVSSQCACSAPRSPHPRAELPFQPGPRPARHRTSASPVSKSREAPASSWPRCCRGSTRRGSEAPGAGRGRAGRAGRGERRGEVGLDRLCARWLCTLGFFTRVKHTWNGAPRALGPATGGVENAKSWKAER